MAEYKETDALKEGGLLHHSTPEKAAFDYLRLNTSRFAIEIIEKMIDFQPDIRLYSPAGILIAQKENENNLHTLFTAIEVDSALLFKEYNYWLNGLLVNRRLPKEIVLSYYTCAKEVFLSKYYYELISEPIYLKIINFIDMGIETLTNGNHHFITYMRDDNPLITSLLKYKDDILSGDKNSAIKLIKKLSNELEIKDIFRHILQPFQMELGELWAQGRISVAQEHYATAVSQLAITLLYDKIYTTPKNEKLYFSTCIQGELHDFGSRMVCDYMESRGWNTYFLGANMPDDDIISLINNRKPDIIAISCTMLLNIYKVKDLIEKIKLRKITTPIIVGGFPFNIDRDLWIKIGADSCGYDFEETYLFSSKLS